MDILKIRITSTVTLYGETEQDRAGHPPSKTPWKKSFQVGTEVDPTKDLNKDTRLADILPLVSRAIHAELAKIRETKHFFEEPQVEEPGGIESPAVGDEKGPGA